MKQLDPITHSAAGQPITILMADDDEDDVELAADALKESRLANGFVSVRNGEELLDYLHQRGDYAHLAGNPQPGLILLDLNMPKMDGREALRQIKADPDLRKIPVVILTTSKSEEDIFRTYDLGVNSFIVKPVTFTELVRAMTALTEYWFQIVRLPEPQVIHSGRAKEISL